MINQTKAALPWRKVQSLTNLLPGDAELLHRWRQQQHHLTLTPDLGLVLLLLLPQKPVGERQKYTHHPLTPYEESLIEMIFLEDPKKHKRSAVLTPAQCFGSFIPVEPRVCLDGEKLPKGKCQKLIHPTE